MFVDCTCGTRNSAMNPRCIGCGAAISEAGDPARPTSARAALQPGASVGAYTIGTPLGSGSVGRVFEARRQSDGQPVALKILHPHLLRSPDARARFLREASAISKVTHPAVAVILESFEWSGTPVIALERYAGSTLRQVLDARGRLAPAEALPLVRALVGGLGAIHEAGWVHRDVKPENVMILDPDCAVPRDVRLLDFGLARSLQVRPGSIRTEAGHFIGSLAYAAPEQLFEEGIGPATDWWALGVVAYEILAGRRPFEAPSRAKLAATLLRSTSVEPPIGGPLGVWVARRLARDPQDRGQGWRAVLAELDDAISPA